MDIEKYMKPEILERYSFLWSEVRLVVAAGALFLGGVPPVLFLFRIPSLYGVIGSLLTVAWIVSGFASAYLCYRWYRGKQEVFGKKDVLDRNAFFVLVVSGFNLGFAGLTGKNIGMSISSNHLLFIIVGCIYLAAAWHLYRRWNESHQKIF